MFEAGVLYTHPKMLDSCILVLKAYHFPRTGYRLRIRWFSKTGMDFGLEERLTISDEKAKEWYEYQRETRSNR